MEASAKFWDRLADRYAKKPIDDMPSYEHKLKLTQSYMTKSTKVLEVGCGTGSTALIHAPHVKHILATDLSGNMIEIARSKAQAQNVSNVDFITSSVENLEVKEPIDMILALSFLHLVEDRALILQKLYSWLKPGGILVTSTVCLGESHKIFKFIGPIGRKLGLLPVLKVFTQTEIRQSILDTGFEIDCNWVPQNGNSIFIIAKKPEGI